MLWRRVDGKLRQDSARLEYGASAGLTFSPDGDRPGRTDEEGAAPSSAARSAEDTAREAARTAAGTRGARRRRCGRLLAASRGGGVRTAAGDAILGEAVDGWNGRRDTLPPASRRPHSRHTRRIPAYPPWHTVHTLCNTTTTARQYPCMHTILFQQRLQTALAQPYGTRPIRRLERSLPSSTHLIRQLSFPVTLSPRIRFCLFNDTHRCFCLMLQ